jgi:FkbM family methyltransferase
MVYEPGQVRNIFPYINFTPAWFLLGGPADGNEAQVIKEQYPEISVIGIEPNPEAFEYQLSHRFPGLLLPLALSDSAGIAKFHDGNIRCGRLTEGGERTVELVTLDALDARYGPFQDSILWLDIEGSEMKALQGATKLLAEKRILLMNIEIIEDERSGFPTLLNKFTEWLKPYGYEVAHAWNCGPLGPGEVCRYRRDVIYRLA